MIGINTLGAMGISGIGFAVPINTAKQLLPVQGRDGAAVVGNRWQTRDHGAGGYRRPWASVAASRRQTRRRHAILDDVRVEVVLAEPPGIATR